MKNRKAICPCCQHDNAHHFDHAGGNYCEKCGEDLDRRDEPENELVRDDGQFGVGA